MKNWRLVEELFDELAELDAPARERVLRERANGDEELVRTLERILAADARPLAELEGTHSGGGEGLGRRGRHRPESGRSAGQLSFFQPEDPRAAPVLARLRALELDRLTPLEALNVLAELRRELGGGADAG